MFIRIVTLSCLLPLLYPLSGVASRSVPAPECPFTGLVKEVKSRTEAGQGISEGTHHEYIDVTMMIYEGANSGVNEYGAACDTQSGSTHIFQLRGGDAPNVGACIRGSSTFFADGNLMSGNWLTVKEQLEASACTHYSQ